MNADSWRSVRRVTVGTAAIIGLGVALMYFQMPRSEQEQFNRYPEDLRTQLKQKQYAQKQYEAQQRAKQAEGRPT